jgi:CNT family concentrative nucleoside transporter
MWWTLISLRRARAPASCSAIWAAAARPSASADPSAAFIFAFQALPAILLVGALSALLWHWKVLIWIVRAAAWAFGKLFGVSGPVGVSTSACVFLGMVEAPLLVKPFLPKPVAG